MPFDLNTLNHLFGYIDLKNKCLTTLTVIIVVISLRFIYKRYFSDQQHFRKMLKSASKHSATKGFDENWNDIVVDEPTNVNYDRQSAVDPVSSEHKSQFLADDCKLMTHLFEDAQTILESLERGCRLNARGNCLGSIDATKKCVQWQSYVEVLDRVRNFANGLHSLINDVDPAGSGMNRCVGIYSSNCIDYVVAEYGSYWHSYVVVPIYDTLGPNACSFITNQAEIECIVCDKLERFQIILSQASILKTLRYIVMLNDIPQNYKQKALSFKIKVYTIAEVEQMGIGHQAEPHKPKPGDLAVICYTSGTTSAPKGVMLTHQNVVANVSAVMFQMLSHMIRIDDVMLSYLPLAHMFERNCENALFMVGGAVVFFSGDVRQLMNDLKIAKPTLLPAVPRLLTRIYCKIHDSVKSNVVKNFLLNTAYYFKQKQIEKTGIVKHNTIWDKIVFNKVRENLGGKVRLIMSGSAPLNPNVLEFLRCSLGCLILEGYGQTECVAPCTVTFPGDTRIGHVGSPVMAAKIKLLDVPDMGYFAKEGKGEILVKGPIVFQGYFKNPQLTAQTLDADGWLHTGDIGLFTENETLQIIDRKKNIFKMSQGEYIAPEKIENIYSQSSLVAQIFVHGESLKSTLVGIVVPDQVVLELWCRNNNIDGDFKQMCTNKEVQRVLLKELQGLGQKDGLKSFEQVKAIYVHPELFSVEQGLITPTFKSKRSEILKQFRKEIDEMYSKLE